MLAVLLLPGPAQSQAFLPAAKTPETVRPGTHWNQFIRAGVVNLASDQSPQIEQVFRCPYSQMHPLDCWLAMNPKVAVAIRWWLPKDGASGTSLEQQLNKGMVSTPWPKWDESHKSELRAAFDAYSQWYKNGMGPFTGVEFAEVVPNRAILENDDSPILNIDYLTGWAIFRSYVAFGLAAEVRHWYSWSIANDSEEDLLDLFLTKQFEVEGEASPDLREGFEFSGSSVTPTPPSLVMNLLKGQNLAQSTRRATVGALLRYMRGFVHFTDYYTTLNMQNYWGYRGPPPMIRILSGTQVQGEEAQAHPDPQQWIHGCHGSTKLQVWLARLFNIPARSVSFCGHEMPYYPSIGYLSHGDDPYSTFSRSPPDYEGQELLVSSAIFQSWFTTLTNDNNHPQCVNVGRRAAELGAQHLPDSIVGVYCYDLARGLSHAEGDIYEYFQYYFSLPQLNDMDLWGRLNSKAAAQGKCNDIGLKNGVGISLPQAVVLPKNPPDEPITHTKLPTPLQ